MKSKNIVLLVVLVVVVVGVYFLSHKASSQKGTVVFGITDAAPDMGSVSSVVVTVGKVEIHSAADGWMTVSSDTKSYDLLVLKQSGAVSLLAKTEVTAGIYDQVRLMVSRVVVVRNGGEVEAKLPSGELKIVGNIVVNSDKTSSIVFDFMADRSLHMTGNGKIIFAPVIRIEKQTEASVEVKANNEVDIRSGKKESDENVGMDSKGEVRRNFELRGDLKIDNDDKISGGDDDQGDDNNDKLAFNFSAQNNSGASGSATLLEVDGGKVKVTLRVTGVAATLLSTTEPAHVHTGSCASIGGVKYPLNSVVNGKSETTLDVSLAQIKASLPLAINVHKSVAALDTYIACTDLKF